MKRLLAAVTVLVLFGCGPKVRPTTDEKVEITPARLERGSYLVNHVMACGMCHDSYENGDLGKPKSEGMHLAGGNLMDEGAMKMFVPNITPDKETGIGSWTDDELMRAIRDGVTRDGTRMGPLMPFEAYRTLSDEDLRSVVAYLRSVEPKKMPHPRQKHTFPFPMGLLVRAGAMHNPPVTTAAEPDRSNKVAYGEYLARAGHCYHCHAMGEKGPLPSSDPNFMAGSQVPFNVPGIGKLWAPNLTPDKETGIGGYTDDQIKLALRTGMRFDGKQMGPPMIAFVPHMAGVAEEDLDAMVVYLRSLAPVKNKVPSRELTGLGKQIFDQSAPAEGVAADVE